VTDTVASAVSAGCSQCGAALTTGDQFCESCGATVGAPTHATVSVDAPVDAAVDEAGEGATHKLPPPLAADDEPPEPLELLEPPATARSAPCACGGEFGDDGWCGTCGAPAPRPRDHVEEQPVAWVAAVSDRGISHSRNEDAAATGAEAEPGSACVLVVCDGVTTATDSDKASLAATRAARDVLINGFASAPESLSGRIVHWTAQLVHAGAAANAQTVSTGAGLPKGVEPPAATFAAAVLHGPLLVAGWVGDSRVYWFPDVGAPIQMSVDDSWATEQIALGMARADAEADRRAHSITRWLGVDSPDAVPRCSTATIEHTGGWLMVCSDGLWNYCSPAAELAALLRTFATSTPETSGISDAVRATETHATPMDVSRALVSWANTQGGHDNISVALARIPSQASEPTIQSALPSRPPQHPKL
jgi:serine/threonine protein phosphatase PrpC